MEELKTDMPHTLFIENRNKLTLTGITDVGSFNEENMRMETSCGALQITGVNLQVTKLDLPGGSVTVEGSIISLNYEENVRKNGGFLARMLG